MKHYLLVGSGVAALSAAEAIRQADPQGEITMLSNDPFGYYSRPGLAYYLTGELSESSLFPYCAEDFQRLGIRFVRGQVQEVDPAQKTVALQSGHKLRYDALLLATGSQAIPLSLPGTNLRGVHKLDHLEDARAILASAKRARHAVVTGGGVTALELVEGLRARGLQVSFVFRNERYWPNVLDPTESRIVEAALAQEGVEIYRKTSLVEILANGDRVAAVRLADGRTLKADLLAYAIGIAPRIDLAQQAGIRCGRGILVDEFMRTNLPDIYAAGDVAEVYDPKVGKYVIDSLWHPARQQGWVAGWNMANHQIPYRRNLPYNVTRLAGLTTTIIGTVGRGDDADLISIARGDSQTWRELSDVIVAQNEFEVNRIRLMLGNNRIVGAVVMGDQTLSSAIQSLILHAVDITPVQDRLLSPHASIAEVLGEFWRKIQTELESGNVAR
ncbi:MAG: NAD(P)/FAD-dependent oxidoreductase [Anaerolineales bacterium]